jgi:hypothetical protein
MSRLNAAKDAYLTETGKPLPITSGYRTTEEQANLFANRGSNPNLVAPPGTSKHEFGNAADISPTVPSSFLDRFGLHRPHGSKDPVHVEANPSFQGLTAQSNAPSSNFADLWESTPQATTTQTTTEQAKTDQPKSLREASARARQDLEPIAGVGEAAISAVYNPLVSLAGTVKGIVQSIPEAIAQGKPPEPIGREIQKQFVEKYGFEPKTETGKTILSAIAKVPEAITGSSMGLPPAIAPEFMAAGRQLAKPGVKTELRQQLEQRFPKIEENVGANVGTNVGAAQANNQTIINEAINRTQSPDLKAELQTLKPQEVNPIVLDRHLEADTLPIPIRLTKGQATQDVKILSDEINSRAKNPELAYRYNEQNAQLIDNINAIKENAAPDVYGTNHVENGQTLIDAYKNIDEIRKADINSKYEALKNAAGGEFPIDGVAFANNAFKQLSKDLKSDFVPPAIEKQLKRFQNGETMTFEQFEAMRTNLAAEMRKASRAGDGNTEMAASIVRNSLEDLPLSGGAEALKPLADEARAAAKNRFDTLKQDKAYKAAVNDAVSADDFIQKFVVNGKKADIDTMVQHLGVDSVARQTMAAGIVNWLKSKAGIVNENGNFSQAGFNKALENIDPKILNIVGSEVNQQLKALGNTARLTQARPKGSYVNESNTFVNQAANLAKGGMEKSANVFLGGGIVPVGTLVREAAQKRAISKATKESLKPGAGTNLKDIGK